MGVLEGLNVTKAFSTHIANYFKSTPLEAIIEKGEKVGMDESSEQVTAALLLSFYPKFPEDWDLKPIVRTLTDLRDYRLKQDRV
jgi:hypothetical protein